MIPQWNSDTGKQMEFSFSYKAVCFRLQKPVLAQCFKNLLVTLRKVYRSIQYRKIIFEGSASFLNHKPTCSKNKLFFYRHLMHHINHQLQTFNSYKYNVLFKKVKNRCSHWFCYSVWSRVQFLGDMTDKYFISRSHAYPSGILFLTSFAETMFQFIKIITEIVSSC